jgi:hypothetical protein
MDACHPFFSYGRETDCWHSTDAIILQRAPIDIAFCKISLKGATFQRLPNEQSFAITALLCRSAANFRLVILSVWSLLLGYRSPASAAISHFCGSDPILGRNCTSCPAPAFFLFFFVLFPAFVFPRLRSRSYLIFSSRSALHQARYFFSPLSPLCSPPPRPPPFEILVLLNFLDLAFLASFFC